MTVIYIRQLLTRQGDLEGFYVHVDLYDIMALLPGSILSVGSHGGFGTVLIYKKRGAIPGLAAGEFPFQS